MQIGSVPLGMEHEPVLVGEVSGNHRGSLAEALRLVRAVAESGARAIKFQTYTPDTITMRAESERFRISEDHELWGGRDLYDLYADAYTPWEWHEQLFALSQSLGLEAFSSPFDESAVDFLEPFDPAAYKIASLEIIDLPLIRKVAGTGRPVIISTGAASLAEIDQAVGAAREAGAGDVMLLACTSSYPADPRDAHLARIQTMRDAWNVEVGLSDHTKGSAVAIAAVALGATLVEKHVIRERSIGGPDAAFSLESDELTATLQGMREAWQSIGRPWIGPTESEQESHRLRPSLCLTRDLPGGHALQAADVDSLRPSGGLPPDAMQLVLGRRLRVATSRGEPVTWEILD